MDEDTWFVFRGLGKVATDNPLSRLPEPPPWRDFANPKQREQYLGKVFQPMDRTVLATINTAIFLRRPLLVEGKPGTGKSSLARAIATELNCDFYQWPISTRTTVEDGLYSYDALARLRDSQRVDADAQERAKAIGHYITLGSLGMALCPQLSSPGPVVLLIDEVDKGDIDLPNDLLHLFEEGAFTIRELVREQADDQTTETHLTNFRVRDPKGNWVPLSSSTVRCQTFPIIVMTSNGEREFPPAFLRRCIRLTLNPPETDQQYHDLVEAHFKTYLSSEQYEQSKDLITIAIARFKAKVAALSGNTHLANDQLLNLIYLLIEKPQLQHDLQVVNTTLKPLGED